MEADLELASIGTDEVYYGHGLVGRASRGHRVHPGHAPSWDSVHPLSPGLRRPVVFLGGRDEEPNWPPGATRDQKRGLAQIEYGLLTDKDGRPVAIEVFSGNTADPTAFISMVEVIRHRFGLDRLTMVGDRGMITSARIAACARSATSGG